MKKNYLFLLILLLFSKTFGQVGIGTSSPDPSAILELNVNSFSDGSKKGFLGPKLSLKSNTDISTIPSPAIGLLVYNTGQETTFPYNGYVFWNGTEWRTLAGASLGIGTIGSFVCNNVSLTPSIYTQGVAYNGTLSVPYTNGNGGVYADQSITSTNGLTAKIVSGNLANGSGVLTYSVTGTPIASSPTTTTFSINLNGVTCNAIVGAGDDVKAGELVYYKTNNIAASIGSGGANANDAASWLSANVDAASPLPIIAGKIRVDGYFTGSANGGATTVSFNPRLVNISSNPIKIWFAALTNVDRFNGANIVLAKGSSTGTPLAGSWVNLDNGIYSNLGSNSMISSPPSASITDTGSANQEVLTMDLDIDNKWYRVYYFINVDNNNTPDITDNFRRLYISIQRLY